MKTQKVSNKILEDIRSLFINSGIKSVTMDDIATHLGISKKTLYQSFSNKKDVVRQVIQHYVDNNECVMEKICEINGNAIDELLNISKKVNEGMSESHPSILYDMQKYYPQSWKIIAKYKENFIYEKVLNNLKKGISEGLYRKDMDPIIIARTYMYISDAMMGHMHEITENYNFFQLHKEIMSYHICGIANDKGREYLKQKFK